MTCYQDGRGATASVLAAGRVLTGTRQRTRGLYTDFDFGFLQLLGTS